MTRAAQKAREQHHLNQFARLLPDFPPGQVVSGERPDFVVGDAMRVGIEVTYVLRGDADDDGSAMKTQESLRCRIVELAEAECTRDGVPGLYVYPYFGELANRSIQSLSRALAAVVKAHVPAPGKRWKGELNSSNLGSWPRELHAVHVWRPEGVEDSLWSPSSAAEYVAPYDATRIQRKLDDKESSRAGYDGTLRSAWLLMVMDDLQHSGSFIIDADCLVARYRSSFDRAFILQVFDGALHELTVSPPA